MIQIGAHDPCCVKTAGHEKTGRPGRRAGSFGGPEQHAAGRDGPRAGDQAAARALISLAAWLRASALASGPMPMRSARMKVTSVMPKKPKTALR